MKKVLILHGFTTEYRVPFFKELHRILLLRNISLKVVIGQSSKYEKFSDIEDCEFFIYTKNKYFYFRNKYLVFEPVMRYLSGNDLIIMRQANKHIVNPFVFLFCRMNHIKIGFWGNMKNYIHNENLLNRRFVFLNKVDHWFAYNRITQKLVSQTGFPDDKISILNNSIDTNKEREQYDSISEIELINLRNEFRIQENDLIGIFCSRFYADKRIDFLLEALLKINQNVDNFKFFIIGDGIESDKITDFQSLNKEWVFYVGSKYGLEKIKFFKLSDFQLLPGAVGLHIVDSFALETPIITTESKTHGVEIDYLINGENGLITKDTIIDYANEVVQLCNNKEKIKMLKTGCNNASKKYTVENMALNFANGILKTLNIE